MYRQIFIRVFFGQGDSAPNGTSVLSSVSAHVSSYLSGLNEPKVVIAKDCMQKCF